MKQILILCIILGLLLSACALPTGVAPPAPGQEPESSASSDEGEGEACANNISLLLFEEYIRPYEMWAGSYPYAEGGSSQIPAPYLAAATLDILTRRINLLPYVKSGDVLYPGADQPARWLELPMALVEEAVVTLFGARAYHFSPYPDMLVSADETKQVYYWNTAPKTQPMLDTQIYWAEVKADGSVEIICTRSAGDEAFNRVSYLFAPVDGTRLSPDLQEFFAESGLPYTLQSVTPIFDQPWQQEGETAIAITTPQQLALLGRGVHAGDKTHIAKSFVLKNDLDMSGVDFTPIGYYNYNAGDPIYQYFSSSFEGGGHTVSNLKVTGDHSVGMFGAIGPLGRVSGLHLKNLLVTGKENVGGLAGYCEGKLTDCTVQGQITGDQEVGGLVGILIKQGQVQRCGADVEVTANYEAGGLAGMVHEAVVTNSYAKGVLHAVKRPLAPGEPEPVGDPVYQDGHLPRFFGGFAASNYGTVDSCYADVDIKTHATAFLVGNFLGYNSESLFNCFYNLDAGGQFKGVSEPYSGVDRAQVTGLPREEYRQALEQMLNAPPANKAKG